MPQWIILRRDANGTVEHVDGLWEAENGAAAIARMCADRGRIDDGNWLAQAPDEQHHVMSWALDAESRGKPAPSGPERRPGDRPAPHHHPIPDKPPAKET